MSHGKVREEKICLNCGAPVPGRFCSACGQENIEPKQTFWHLVTHFFSDVTHFDGKFFLTVKDLFRKPGFLSTEYIKGRRMSYLDPIRMYIFTSAFFFLIFFSMVNLHDLETKRSLNSNAEIEKGRIRSLALATTRKDSVAVNATFDALESRQAESDDPSILGKVGKRIRQKTDSANRAADSIASMREARLHGKDSAVKKSDTGWRYYPPVPIPAKDKKQDSVGSADAKSRLTKDSIKIKRTEKKKVRDEDEDDEGLSFDTGDDVKEFRTVAAYDSAQAALPPEQRHGWLKRIVKRKVIETNQKWRDDKEGMWREWAATFLHNFPKMLFISLPLFALLLKLLYVRRKQFYYVDHGIFAVHLYIYSFLLLLVFFGLRQLNELTHFSLFKWLEYALLFYGFWYYYKSMRNFYCQGRGKTILKYFALLMLSFILQMFLFSIFFLFSIVQA